MELIHASQCCDAIHVDLIGQHDGTLKHGSEESVTGLQLFG